MNYRKLQIAWSVGCGILCLLLVALWVRSYPTGAYFIAPIADKSLYCGAEEGELQLLLFHDALAIRWDRGFRTPQASSVVAVVDAIGFRILYVKAFYSGIIIPYWFGLAIWIVLAFTRPKVCIYRFSLRTLLLAATVVAVALGLLVMMLRGQ